VGEQPTEKITPNLGFIKKGLNLWRIARTRGPDPFAHSGTPYAIIDN